MEEHQADQLWRDFTDTDRAAKRGHGIGFGHAPSGTDPLETGDPPSGLGSHFRKATDVASKDMAQEKVSARDRIRARIKDAMLDKTASQRKEDSQWEDFITRKKRELVGMSSIVDDRGHMLGCTYNYTDVDTADLEKAMSRATATRAAADAAAEDDHAAAIFGGSASMDHTRERETEAAVKSRSHHHRTDRSPDRPRRRNAQDRDRSLERPRERSRNRDRSPRHHGRAEPDRHRQHRAYEQRSGPSDRRADRRESWRDSGRNDRHGERARAGDERSGRGSEDHSRGDHGRSRAYRDRSPSGGVDHERGRDSRRHSGRDDTRNTGKPGRAGGRESRYIPRRSAPAKADSRTSSGRHDPRVSPEIKGHDIDAGPRQSAAAHDSSHGLARCAGGAAGRVRDGMAGPRASETAAAGSGARAPPGGGRGAGERGEVVAAAAQAEQGRGPLGGIAPEGAIVVEESDIVRAAPEVEEHSALDAAAVLKARGSWREKLKRRAEGVP